MRSSAHDVAIIGGGVMGVSLARALARAGADVTLYSSTGLGSGGASAVPVALLNPFRGRTGRAHPDDLTALDVTWRWAEELGREGLDPGHTRGGLVRVADGTKQARAFACRDGLRPFPAGGAPPPYRSPYGGAVAPAAGWLEPRRWIGALAASAANGGATLRTGSTVVAIEASSGRWRLHLDAGPDAHHGRIVIATGADAWPTARSTDLRMPALELLAGDVVVTSLPAPAQPLAGAIYLGPVAVAGVRRAAIGGHHRPPGPPVPGTAARLRAALRWVWPDLASEAGHRDDEQVWWAVRARADDGRPHLAELAPGVWWAGALAGRGFLAAASLAEEAVVRLRVGASSSGGRTRGT